MASAGQPFDSDFNYDFHVSHTEQELRSGAVEYNFRERDFRPRAGEERSWERLDRVDVRT